MVQEGICHLPTIQYCKHGTALCNHGHSWDRAPKRKSQKESPGNKHNVDQPTVGPETSFLFGCCLGITMSQALSRW
jgi:hypothetical protein